VRQGMTAGLVSIITPSFNHAPYIRDTIESVLAQNYPLVEHIVMDGGSSDGTVDILREYGERYPDRFRWVSEPDQGQSDALNKGIGLARGEFLGWQNSDDYYYPNVFEAPLSFLASHPDIALVYSDIHFVEMDGSPSRTINAGQYSYTRLLGGFYIFNQGAFFRRAAIEQAGGFNIALHYAMDLEMWLRLGRHCQFHYMPGVRGAFRQLPSAKSATGRVRSRLEIMSSLEAIATDPELPPRFRPEAMRSLRRGMMNALLVLLIDVPNPDLSPTLENVRKYDPDFHGIDYLCDRLIDGLVGFDWLIRRVGTEYDRDLPQSIRMQLQRAGVLSPRQLRSLISIEYLYKGLESNVFRQALPYVILALQNDWRPLRHRGLRATLARSCGRAIFHGQDAARLPSTKG
jgi:hypothetical protein